MTREDAAIVLLGALAIAAGAQVTVPMVPVPMTLQTLGVIAVGLLAGPWRGAAAAAIYLLMVLGGLPVLSDGGVHGGLDFFAQPTAGYVVGFIPGAAVAGWLGARERWWLLGAGVAGHAVVLLLGVAVLSRFLGVEAAIDKGCTPFLAGAVVKSAAAAVLAFAATRAGFRGGGD